MEKAIVFCNYSSFLHVKRFILPIVQKRKIERKIKVIVVNKRKVYINDLRNFKKKLQGNKYSLSLIVEAIRPSPFMLKMRLLWYFLFSIQNTGEVLLVSHPDGLEKYELIQVCRDFLRLVFYHWNLLSQYFKKTLLFFLFILCKYISFKKSQDGILMVEPCGGIGDLIVTIPALQELRRSIKGYILLTFTDSRWGKQIDLREIGEILKKRQIVDDFILLNERKGLLWGMIKYIFSMKKIGILTFKKVLFFKRAPELEFYFSAFSSSPLLGSDVCYYLSDTDKKYLNEMEAKIEFIRKFVQKYYTSSPVKNGVYLTTNGWFSSLRKDYIQTIMKSYKQSKKFIVGLNVGRADTLKTWPIENYLEVVKVLIKSYEAIIIIVDRQFLRQDELNLFHGIKENVIEVDTFTISDLIALIGSLSLLISYDTAAIHISRLLNVPTIALFGPTNPTTWGYTTRQFRTITASLRPPCSPCYLFRNCLIENKPCMRRITPQQVLSEIKELFLGK